MRNKRPAAEDDRKKYEKTEQNFPSIGVQSHRGAPAGNKYARLAEKWAIDEEVDRRMAEYKRLQEEADRRDVERIAVRHAQRSRFERHDEEYDEEELAPTPSAPAEGFGDDAGWTEVKRKTYKPKRELTVEEMDELDRKRQEEDTTEFNAHLFDSKRHDHDKV
jgi:hypothetical protein